MAAIVLAVIAWQSKQMASDAYPKAGTAFAFELIALLGLTDWENGLPSFTEEEQEAIQAGLDRFQRDADAQMGGSAVFHPDVAPLIQRKIGAEALKDLASEDDIVDDIFAVDDEPPWRWRERVSTYLKAWTISLDPMILIEVSGLLGKAGHKKEAKDALNVVVSHFKGYAPRFFGGTGRGNAATAQVIFRAMMRMRTL